MKMKEIKNIGKILKGGIKVTEKRSAEQILKENKILEKICIALNANNVEGISNLVESAFDVGYTAEEIKKAIRDCMARPDFDVICEFCRAMRFEENKIG